MMITSERRVERLEKALEVMLQPIKDLPIDIFDMGDWGSNMAGEGVPKVDCKTAACGAGTLSLHPWFRKRGFASRWVFGELAMTGGWRERVASFFAISDEEAYALTRATYGELDGDKAYGGITTKRQFVARLRRLLKHYTQQHAANTNEVCIADD